jgi:hypothetical protein
MSGRHSVAAATPQASSLLAKRILLCDICMAFPLS